jgi:hypothetical protein
MNNNSELTISEAMEYCRENYKYWIGPTECLENQIGQPGIWLHFFKPDRKYFVHIMGQMNRIDFVARIYEMINNLVIDEYMTANY